MIKATFYRTSDNMDKGFTIQGHAGFAKAGKDILCAAVSVLSINTINSMEEFTDNDFVVEQGKSGTIKFKFVSEPDNQGQLLIRSLSYGLMQLHKEYGDKYLQVYFKEV